MIRAIMHGCNGRMGNIISDLAEKDDNIEIVAGVDPTGKGRFGYPVFYSIDDCDVEADVVIDFSNASAVPQLLAYCVEKQVPCVLCTTGLSAELTEEVVKASEKVAMLKSANMSLGINLLMKLLKEASQVLANAGFDIEIVEKHHNQKLDAPSGTAIALADAINEEFDGAYEYVFDRSQRRAKEKSKKWGFLQYAVALS